MKKNPSTAKMTKDHLVINGKTIPKNILFPFLVRTNNREAVATDIHSSSLKKRVLRDDWWKPDSVKRIVREKEFFKPSQSNDDDDDDNLNDNDDYDYWKPSSFSSFVSSSCLTLHGSNRHTPLPHRNCEKSEPDEREEVLYDEKGGAKETREKILAAVELASDEYEEEVTIPKNTKFGVQNGFLDWKQTQFVRQTGFCQDFQVENVSSCHKVSFCTRKKKNSVHDIYIFLKNRNVHHTVLETSLKIYRSTCEKMGVLRNHLKMGVVAASVFKAYTLHNKPQDFNDLIKELDVDLKLANRGLRCINMNNDDVRVVMNTAKQEMAVVLKLLEITNVDTTGKIFADFDVLFSLCANVVDFCDYRIFCVILLNNLGFISNMKKTCALLRLNLSSLKKLNVKIESFLHIFNKNKSLE